MASEDYTVQVSYKFGTALQNMVNVRADDPSELQANVDAMNDDNVVSSIVNLGAKLDAVAPIAGALATPTQTPTAAAPAASAPAAPTAAPSGVAPCAHGPRQVVKTKKWIGYFCALPKGTPGACQPVFQDPS